MTLKNEESLIEIESKKETKATKKTQKDSKKVEKKPLKSDSKKSKVAEEKKAKGEKIQHGKKHREASKLVEKGKEYTIDEAIDLLKKTTVTNFDSSVEIHINLNVDVTNPEQQIRGSVSLPAGLGKSKKVCAIVGPDKDKEAKEAGAEYVGSQDLIEKIEKGWLDFDVVVATPDMMPHVGKVGKILGTKGLMPNPKTGTVTTNVKQVILEIKKGKADYRVDGSGSIHASLGKVSFDNSKLKENIETFISVIHQSKPNSVKGKLVKSIFLTTTMGPGIKITE